MMPEPAQYLLRFDDLCPTLLRGRWHQFEALISEYAIRPILAVVPDNVDPQLMPATPDPKFWERMRALESAGATIALHGYRHLCTNRGKSLVPLHTRSEFAGESLDIQRSWIHSGVEILRNHGLNPPVFVAPRHGFDEATLRALSEEGIAVISDGFGRVPFTRGGLIWIPQQLWAPVEKSKGLWTICIHSNTANDEALAELRAFLERHADAFTSIDRVLEECGTAPHGWTERLRGELMLRRVLFSRFRKERLRIS